MKHNAKKLICSIRDINKRRINQRVLFQKRLVIIGTRGYYVYVRMQYIYIHKMNE